MRGSDYWQRLVRGWTRFDHGLRHLQARRPVVMGFAQGLLVGLGVLFLNGRATVGLAIAVLYGVSYAVMSAYWWRPGGIARLQYERWSAAVELRSRPAVIPDRASPPGWYANPKRKNRAGYWTGAEWV